MAANRQAQQRRAGTLKNSVVIGIILLCLLGLIAASAVGVNMVRASASEPVEPVESSEPAEDEVFDGERTQTLHDLEATEILNDEISLEEIEELEELEKLEGSEELEELEGIEEADTSEEVTEEDGSATDEVESSQADVEDASEESQENAGASEEESETLDGSEGVSQVVSVGWLEETSQRTGIPKRALAAYAGADSVMRAEHGCSVGWNTLAGIGHVESNHGRLQDGGVSEDGRVEPAIIGVPLDGGDAVAHIADTDGGALDGDATYDRAVGPMQFIPSTWARWGVDGSGDGKADPHNIDDAAMSAASYLCHAREGLDDADSWISAIRSYNNSVQYQNDVAEAANHYGELAAN